MKVLNQEPPSATTPIPSLGTHMHTAFKIFNIVNVFFRGLSRTPSQSWRNSVATSSLFDKVKYFGLSFKGYFLFADTSIAIAAGCESWWVSNSRLRRPSPITKWDRWQNRVDAKHIESCHLECSTFSGQLTRGRHEKVRISISFSHINSPSPPPPNPLLRKASSKTEGKLCEGSKGKRVSR